MRAPPRPNARQPQPQPQTTDEPQRPRSAYGEWFMRNVRAEVAAGRVRQTLDPDGQPVTIH
jgi:hypothetical protein